jgi:gliding motility-associated lipoprotein GldH
LKIFIYNIALLLIFLVFNGCDNQAIYDQSIPIKDEIWNRDNVLEFQVEIQDSIRPNDFYIQLRNTTDYPYSNLYFFLDTEFPNGEIIRDTIQCILAEPNGKWIGEGLGKIKSNRILLRNNVRFPYSGYYLFRVEHAMRVVDLAGIADFGIRIELADYEISN